MFSPLGAQVKERNHTLTVAFVGGYNLLAKADSPMEKIKAGVYAHIDGATANI